MAAHNTPLHFKKLIGEKVYLSPLNSEDVERFTTWLNDMEMTQYLTISHHIYSMQKEKEYLDKKVTSDAKAFAIIDRESDRLLGACDLFDVDMLHGTAELGIFIGEKSFWGRGFGRDAVKLVLDFGFSVLNLRNIWLRTLSVNERGIKSFEHAGFKSIGVRRGAYTICGASYDWVFMDITAEEFESTYVKSVWEKARTGERPHQISLLD